MPPISPDGGWPLVLARALTVAALLSAFGALVFSAVVLPKVAARVPVEATARAVARLAGWSLAGAVVALFGWAVLQTADFAGVPVGMALASLPTVLGDTEFGHVLLAQLACVLAGLGLLRWPRAALAASALAVVLQAGHSHAWSMYGEPSFLLLSDGVHLVAAGAWLGGLWPLLLAVCIMPPLGGAMAARWFSPLGKWCVAGLVASALFQAWVLVGGLPGLIGTAYGWVVLMKLALLAVLLGFACVNRYRLAPALLRPAGVDARALMIRAIAVQTGFGLCVVLAAGVLSALPPGLHEQPDWPFAVRPSLAVMAEPELASEVWTGLLLALAAAAVLAGLGWRRLRRLPFVMLLPLGALGLGWAAWPHLTLLLVEAYPTSYYTSPTEFAATSIVQGAAMYPTHCAACHGASGKGDGPAAASLVVPPADLTAAHLWEHSDGELFWWLTAGIQAPDGSLAMPGFGGTLSPDQRWALIDAIRARNAGTALRDTGTWPRPVPAPAFDIVCDGVHRSTADLRGTVLYMVTGDAADSGQPATTIRLMLGRPATAGAGCTAADPTAWDALAILIGRTPGDLVGTRLLIDANGWLRDVQPPQDAAAWNDPARLGSAIRHILDAPLSAPEGGHHHH